MATGPVRWTFGPRESWLSRIATYAPHALVGGLSLLFLLSGAALVAHGAVDASTLAVALILVLVGGPLSALYCWLLVRYGSNGSKWFAKYTASPHATKRGTAIATVVGAAVIASSALVPPELLAALFVAILSVVVFGGQFTATVELDPRERRLTLSSEPRLGGATVVSLEDVTGVWRLPLGPLSRWQFVVLRQVRGPPLFVPVPDRHAETFHRTLESCLEATPVTEPRTAGTTRPMRIALAATGFGFLGIAVGFAVLVVQTEMPGGGRAFMPVGLLVLFAFITLGYAGYESWLARRGTPSWNE